MDDKSKSIAKNQSMVQEKIGTVLMNSKIIGQAQGSAIGPRKAIIDNGPMNKKAKSYKRNSK